MARGFSPLDEQLQLLPGTLTPRLHEQLVRLGSWITFRKAVRLLGALTGARVSEATARRRTEGAGAVLVAAQDQEVARLEQECPKAPAGPAKQLLSADGAYVLLRDGTAAEVRTLVVGEIGEPVFQKKSGEWVAPARSLSYFSRMAQAEPFTRLALIETQRRGTENAGLVAAVMDGAEWLQGLIDHHRPDAVRVLDFCHAAQRLPQIAGCVWGEAASEGARWAAEQTKQLKEQGPTELLAEVDRLLTEHPEAAGLAEHAGYLRKREAQLQYPEFRALGVPIGSGAVESANKLVVEARLKGAGMRWAAGHVNPLVALRAVEESRRWEEVWPQIAQGLREEGERRPGTRRPQRQAAAVPMDSPASEPAPPASEPTAERPSLQPRAVKSPTSSGEKSRRPAADHPWRRFHLGRTPPRLQPS